MKLGTQLKRVAIFFLGMGALFLFSFSSVWAQQKSADPLSITVEPEAPAPGAETTITITSSSVDLGSAQIIWSLNGAPVASGSGVRTFSFTMGGVGGATIVALSVDPLQGSSFTRTFIFRPGSVILLWEANTYTPPFYVGKALYSPGANIRILALTSVADSGGVAISPENLIFKWEINGDAYADRSGLGKNVLDITGGQLRQAEIIGVDVLRADGSKAGRGDVLIPTTPPRALFYKKDPLRGVLYEKALRESFQLSEQETTFVAEPYYIAGRSRGSGEFIYEWTLNGLSIDPQGEDKSTITLRQEGSQSGRATLSFSMQNTNLKKLLQQTSATLQLILSGGSNNLFGL